MFNALLFAVFALWIAAFVPDFGKRWDEATGKTKSKDKEGQVISLAFILITGWMILWMFRFLARLLF